MVDKDLAVPRYLNQLMDIVKSYETYIRSNIEGLDITMGEVPILLAIYEDEGLNQIDLVKKFHVTEANISKTTKHLLEKGLIIKEIDSDNNTKKLLYVTDSGEEICKELIEFYNIWKDDVISGVSNQNLSTFANVLDVFAINSQNFFEK